MTGVLSQRGHRDRHTVRMPCGDKGREQADSTIKQGTPKTASKPPEARTEA